jgi:hypothetical protein
MEQVATINVTIDTTTFQCKISKDTEGYTLWIGQQDYPIIASDNVEAFNEGMVVMGNALKSFAFPIALGDKA